MAGSVYAPAAAAAPVRVSVFCRCLPVRRRDRAVDLRQGEQQELNELKESTQYK